MRLRLGTRGSALARAQTALVAEALRGVRPDVQIEVVVIMTAGDRLRGHIPVEEGPDVESIKGLFTKEIEEGLLRGEVDVAVHSLKDLPAVETPGLRIAAVPPRADPSDAVVTRDGRTLGELDRHALVGTGSARREVLIREMRPDLRVVSIRGNVDTRLRKLAAGEVDALVLAAAGLIRLGRQDVITETLPPDVFVPAPGQGALAIQIRADDGRVGEVVAALDDPPTRLAVEVERLFTERVGGGCRLPVGAYCVARDGRLALTGMVYHERPVRVRVEGSASEGRTLALQAAQSISAAAGVGDR